MLAQFPTCTNGYMTPSVSAIEVQYIAKLGVTLVLNFMRAMTRLHSSAGRPPLATEFDRAMQRQLNMPSASLKFVRTSFGRAICTTIFYACSVKSNFPRRNGIVTIAYTWTTWSTDATVTASKMADNQAVNRSGEVGRF